MSRITSKVQHRVCCVNNSVSWYCIDSSLLDPVSSPLKQPDSSIVFTRLVIAIIERKIQSKLVSAKSVLLRKTLIIFFNFGISVTSNAVRVILCRHRQWRQRQLEKTSSKEQRYQMPPVTVSLLAAKLQ